MPLSFVPVLLGSHVLVAAANLPRIDLEKLCHTSERAMAFLGGEPTKIFDSCMSIEQQAREQLLKDWATYLPSDKALCMRTKDYLSSYVEWITCAEMAMDLRRIRKKNSVPEPPPALLNRQR